MKYSEAKQYLKEGMTIKVIQRYSSTDYKCTINPTGKIIELAEDKSAFSVEGYKVEEHTNDEFKILTNPDGSKFEMPTKETEIPNNLIIRVPTQEAWNEVIQILLDNGSRWYGGDSDLLSKYWNSYRKDSCLRFNIEIQFSNYDYYKENCPNYTFLTHTEFIEKYGKEKDKEFNYQECINRLKNAINPNLINEPMAQKEKTFMKKLTELSAAIRRTFSSDQKALWQAGYIDDCGKWTTKAQDVADEALLNKWLEDNKVEVISFAREEIEAEKE